MKYDCVVDADGSGDYRTIQEAIDAAYSRKRPRRIHVKRGEYTEQIVLPESPDITIEEAES